MNWTLVLRLLIVLAWLWTLWPDIYDRFIVSIFLHTPQWVCWPVSWMTKCCSWVGVAHHVQYVLSVYMYLHCPQEARWYLWEKFFITTMNCFGNEMLQNWHPKVQNFPTPSMICSRNANKVCVSSTKSCTKSWQNCVAQCTVCYDYIP